MKTTRIPKKGISFFCKACIMVFFSQVIACDCGSNPGTDDNQPTGKDINEQPAEEKLKINLTAPSLELKQSIAKSFELELTVVEGELDPTKYSLVAEHLASYKKDDYTDEVTNVIDNASAADSSSKPFTTVTLRELTLKSKILKENDKTTIQININRKPNPTSIVDTESGSFKFHIQDSKGTQVGNPVTMKWTTKA